MQIIAPAAGGKLRGHLIKVAGLTLQNQVMNGAYIGSKTSEDAISLIESRAGAIVVGSISMQPRVANGGQGYWRHQEGLYSLNSYGMPNGGFDYFKKELPKIVQLAHSRNKPVIVNIVGFSLDDFVPLAQLAENSGCDMAELNLGCPNVWDAGKQKRIISYHPELIKEVLDSIKASKLQIAISIKISPVPPDTLADIVRVIAESGVVRAVVATNSYPNAFGSAKSRVGGEPEYAGMTGRALKPISLGIVKQLSVLLPSDIDIIGCGGIMSLNDVNDYVSAGAKAVQVATALVDQGLGVFQVLTTQEDMT